ncbi:hypothetical protein EDB19DRAFT_1835849 [Suillus lakei]|nr:hypothetical protein EDB19DRAFT_1835849 [Suillus lakei]
MSSLLPQQARVFAVLKWFISSIQGQYTSRNESTGSAKKYVVVAFESCACRGYGYWLANAARGGKTTLVVEHASRHPPITACRIENLENGVILTRHSAQKTSQRSNAKAKAKATSPENHTFKVTLTPPSHIYASPHVVEGKWHTTSKESHSGVAFHDVTSPKEEITVAPLEEQGEWESRKLWYGVAKGLRKGDFESAALFNGKTENKQMQRRSDESTGGMTWELKHFKHVEHDPVYTNSNSLCEDEHLGKLFKANPPTEDGYVYLGNGPIS